MAKIKVIAIDLAKDAFQVCAMSSNHKTAFNRTLKRDELASFMAQHPPVTAAIEARYSSHYWGRTFMEQGHTGLVNQARGLLSEYGIVAPQGLKAFTELLREVVTPGRHYLSGLVRPESAQMMDEDCWLSDRIDDLHDKLSRYASRHGACKILLSIVAPASSTPLRSTAPSAAECING